MLTHEKKMARIERAKQHAATDRLRSGYYSTTADQSLGCSVGCDAIDIAGWRLYFDNPHAIVAEHDGTPEWLERLRDAVFEGLPKEDRAGWHVALAEALPVGVDMQAAYHSICAAMLEQTLEHRSTWADSYGVQVEAAIRQVIAHHNNPTKVTHDAQGAARNAAWSAAWSTEWSAQSTVRSAAIAADASVAAASSARSAADVAVKSAECAHSAEASVAGTEMDAANVAEWAAWRTVESAAWRRIAATVIGILSAQAQ